MKLLPRFLFPLLAAALLVAPAANAQAGDAGFSQAELDQMLAPVALYPDVLLSQVLMAATYPLDVVEAARWTRANPDLKGDDAVVAVDTMDWDQSVKELVGFPDLMQLMDDNLSWTRRLGEAFLNQEEQVMETVQSLRQKALATGSLDDLAHANVDVQDDVIVIEPQDVRTVYVPYYSTQVVYGDWWWYDYPPYYWNPPPGSYFRLGFYWGTGWRVSTGFYFSSCDWHRRHVVIHRPYRQPARYDFSAIPGRGRHDHESVYWRSERTQRRPDYSRRGDYPVRSERQRGEHQSLPPQHVRTETTQQRVRSTETGQQRERVERMRDMDRTQRTVVTRPGATVERPVRQPPPTNRPFQQMTRPRQSPSREAQPPARSDAQPTRMRVPPSPPPASRQPAPPPSTSTQGTSSGKAAYHEDASPAPVQRQRSSREMGQQHER